MGVFGYIKRAKEEFQQERSEKKAGKLAGLRTERIKQEGRAKIDRAYDLEKQKTKTAKKERFNRSFTGKSISNLKRFQKKSQARSRAMNKAGSSKNEINPAFDIGSKKKKSIFD